jgi:outer membrane murein-binding lipoprotein Lpp
MWKERSMRRLIAVAVLLGGFALSGCVHEYHHNRSTTTVTQTQNADGTTTVTRTEVVREAVPAPYYYPSYWGWYGYPYYGYPYYGWGYYGHYHGGCYPHHH